MSVEKRISRSQFIRSAGIGFGIAAAGELLTSCGPGAPNQEVFQRDVVQAGQATEEAQLRAIQEGVSRVIGEITLTVSQIPKVQPVQLTEEQINQIQPEADSSAVAAAHAHAREQLNAVFSHHDQMEPVGPMNREISNWINAFIADRTKNGFASTDYDVLDAALPFVWNPSSSEVIREDILYLLATARQSGKWEGHPSVPQDLINLTWSIGARNWGYDKQQFATAPQYEHLRTSLIETAARAEEAVKKMKGMDLFAHPDQAIPSAGVLIGFGITETGGWRGIGDSGAAREKGSPDAVDYVVQYTRESTGVNVPLTIEGSSAAALGPQILPGNFVEAINFAKKRAPDAKLNPLDIVDGMIFTAIYLQQEKYDAPGEEAQLPAGQKFWYYSNYDDPASMYTVMSRWNAKDDQDQLLRDSHFEYLEMLKKRGTARMDRRRMLGAAKTLLNLI